MIEVKKTGVLFTKTDLEFENEGVLNPVVIREDEWELHGEVNNVVFPTGTALFGSTLFIYYGAANTQIACASVKLPELMAELLTYAGKDEKKKNYPGI